ncbi:MAG: phosphoribosylaminoimidazolecarboxamide formyltransferase [Peptostreptococcaceae bacterium]|nr:phosphoribosylaminoimidazolecarboxamide formyltransferase [Peptostreptococcaceae bacterium]
MELKYGCNPNQKPASVYMEDGKDLPFEVLNGRPGYINLLDALNGWQLVAEIKKATGKPAATSFKHVSPTAAAIGNVMSARLKRAYFVDDIIGLDKSPIATAYARARGADRMSSFGDFISLSDTCDETCASIIKREVSDGIIAPDFTEEALEILKEKKKGHYVILKVNPDYVPAEIEKKQVFGVTFDQKRNDVEINKECMTNIVTTNKDLNEDALNNLLIASITLKYTQSNSVAFAADGQVIGVGAGQQSRIHCTRLAGAKADNWILRQSDKVLNLPFKLEIGRALRDNFIDRYIAMEDTLESLSEFDFTELFSDRPDIFLIHEKLDIIAKAEDIALASDAFFPFGDNIDRAYQSKVKYVVQAGGSIRDSQVIDTCNKYDMVMICNGIRLFHH